MSRVLGLPRWLVALALLLSASIGFGQSWTIGYPYENQQFLKTANVSGTGGAPQSGVSYIFSITSSDGDVTYQSAPGMTYDYMGVVRWTAVCTAPEGGYPAGDAQAVLFWDSSIAKHIKFVES